MIIDNLDTITLPTLIDKLAASKFTFYLTGSRYFSKYSFAPKHKIHSNTDHDYFTEFNEEILKFLKELNFDYVSASEYCKQTYILEEKDQIGITVEPKCYSFYTDKNIVGVCFSACRTIDVQLVKNLELKKEVQRILSCMGDFYYNLSKKEQKWLWDKQYERICKERNISL